MKDGDVHSPEQLLDAAQVLSRSLCQASLETLEGAHALLEAHFLSVVEAAGGSLGNAAEQRLIGILWAEVEIAVDQRRAELAALAESRALADQLKRQA